MSPENAARDEDRHDVESPDREPCSDAYAGGVRLLFYTVLRVAIVLACAGVLYLLGMRAWLLWVTAIVVGALVSFLVLRRQHAGAAEVLAEYDPLREKRPVFSDEVEADAAYEDAAVDAAARSSTRESGSNESGSQPAPGAESQVGSGREADAEQDSVAEAEESRVPEDDDELPPRGTAKDHP
ncbi:hypothetical protein GCM10023169_07750 [Georgenia halophila]|uniref:DUF4229 domain-containing protein n=1 Tax=Georgenia halophila TaxID=620889 RepID=A0ABP8KYJ0_9MICO